MREFSKYERDLIKGHLIKGSGISGMLSSAFKEKAKFKITFDPSGSQKFEYFSSEFAVEDARDEMVNLIELLEFLLSEKYIRKYPPTATSLRDFNETETISFGDSWSAQQQTFILHEKSNYLGEFLKWNEDSIFKATESLKNLALNDFQTAEEIRHVQILRQSRHANKITLGLAISTVLIGFIGIFIQKTLSEEEIGINKRHLNFETKNSMKDSVTYTSLLKELKKINDEQTLSMLMIRNSQRQIDSIKLALTKRRIKK
jgi:hypothetical protein